MFTGRDHSALDSATQPSYTSGIQPSRETTSSIHKWNIEASGTEAADNARRIASLRARLQHQGHSLPLSLIQAEIKDFSIGSSHSERSESELDFDAGVVGSRPTGTTIAPIRSSFVEVGASRGVVSNERWYPRLVQHVPQTTQPPVMDYTSYARPVDISKLASQFEARATMESPLAPVHGGGRRGTSTFDEVVSTSNPMRRSARLGTQHQPSVKQLLLKNAPWKVESEVVAAPQVEEQRRPTEPETELILAASNLDCQNLEGLIKQLNSKPELLSLDLSFNPNLKDIGVQALAETVMCHPGLRTLKLIGCCIGDQGASVLSEYIGTTRLTEIDLRWNGITNNGAYLLRKSIARGVNVQELKLKDERLEFTMSVPLQEGARLGLQVNQDGLIVGVHEGSCASRAVISGDNRTGIRMLIPGMVITRFNKKKVKTSDEILARYKKCVSGRITISVKSNRIPSKSLGKIDTRLKTMPFFNGDPHMSV